MENINATKIESGIAVAPAKKIKLSNFNEVVNKWNKINNSELEKEINVAESKMDDKTDLNIVSKPEWDLVNMNDILIQSANNSKPIRIRKDGIEQAKDKYKFIREENIYGSMKKQDKFKPIETSEEIKEFDSYSDDYNSNISKDLESFGFDSTFSKATENVIENNSIPEFDIPTFEPKDFKPEENVYEDKNEHFDFEERRVEQTANEEDLNSYEIQEMVKKALENVKEEKNEMPKEETSFSINNFDLAEQGLMDVIKASERKLKEKREANRKIEERIEKIKNSTRELEKSRENYERAIQQHLNEINSEIEEENQKAMSLEEERRKSIENMLIKDKAEHEAGECYEYIQSHSKVV